MDALSSSPSSRVDLLGPHILRALANVKIVSIHSSCSAVHFVCIDSELHRPSRSCTTGLKLTRSAVDGNAHLFGRNSPTVLGPTSLGTSEYITETQPKCISPQSLGAGPGVKFASAFLGKQTTFLVGSDGQLWSCGENKQGQCGIVGPPQVEDFLKIDGSWGEAKVVGGAAGANFSIILTDDGQGELFLVLRRLLLLAN